MLVRHGETIGYDGDLGLTAHREGQARDRGSALAAKIKPGTTVRMPHARTARGTATAVALRAALVEALGGEAVDGIEIGPLYPEPWFDNLRYSLHGRGVDTSDAVTARLAQEGELPDWAREYDRFDSDYRVIDAAGGPSTTGCTTPRCTSSLRTWPRIGCGGELSRQARTDPPTCSWSPARTPRRCARWWRQRSARTPASRTTSRTSGCASARTARDRRVPRAHRRDAGAAAAAVDRPGLVRVVRALNGQMFDPSGGPSVTTDPAPGPPSTGPTDPGKSSV